MHRYDIVSGKKLGAIPQADFEVAANFPDMFRRAATHQHPAALKRKDRTLAV